MVQTRTPALKEVTSQWKKTCYSSRATFLAEKCIVQLSEDFEFSLESIQLLVKALSEGENLYFFWFVLPDVFISSRSRIALDANDFTLIICRVIDNFFQ